MFRASMQFAGLAMDEPDTHPRIRRRRPSTTPMPGTLVRLLRRNRQRNCGNRRIAQAKGIAELSTEKDDVALPENESVTPEKIVVYRKGPKIKYARASSNDTVRRIHRAQASTSSIAYI